ncbi:MAG: hypothetical protein ACFFDW_05155 [Candidatus Thorarchaeota archaeon]
MIGIISVVLVVSLVTFGDLTITHAEDFDDDPGDPGNSPGPGIDPNLGSIGEIGYKFINTESISPFDFISTFRI